jgi:dimethylhistidine N-methyltransferase
MMRNAASLAIVPPLQVESPEFVRDMAACLERTPHEISPKYFYDAAGSRLFERICELPEYYVTRTELDIFARDVHQMAALVGPNAEIIEFGAGSLVKARLLLASLRTPRRFIAVDISAEHLYASAAQLQRDFPAVEVIPIVGDFSHIDSLPFLPPSLPGGRRVGFFPGSTLGNFSTQEARHFLRAASRLLAGGGLLIGIDLVKAPHLLQKAYNDTAGVTAAFNRNLLVRANRELGTDFCIDAFAHHAFYHPVLQRVEMHLLCMEPQRVCFSHREFELRRGETIHTENSQKYTVEGFRDLVVASGFQPRALWCDPGRLFSIHWLESSSEERMGRWRGDMEGVGRHLHGLVRRKEVGED